jgi:hypothetical protein
MRAQWRALLFAAVLAGLLAVPATAGAAVQWVSPRTISASGANAFNPQVAVDGSGNAVSVWIRNDGTNDRVQAAIRPAGGEFGTATFISDPGQNAFSPQVAVDPAGNATAVWYRSDGSVFRIQAAFRPAGGSFGAPVTISDAGQGAFDPQVSMNSTGDAIVVWVRSDGTKTRIQSSIRPASTGVWDPAETISQSGQDATEPQIAAMANQSGVAVWTRFDGTNLRIQANFRQDVPGFVRPKGATPVRIPFVPAYNQCTGAGNRTHGPPLANPSCNPPVQSSTTLTIGSPDANGAAANFQGSMRYAVVTGNVSTPANEADVVLTVSMADIRKKSDLTDYTGKVLVTSDMAVSDKYNGTLLNEPGTSQTVRLNIPVQCTATAVTTIGSDCNLGTSANTILPGAVFELRRAIWDMGQIIVKDAGPNGTGYGAGCPPTCGDGDETVFLREGIFIP